MFKEITISKICPPGQAMNVDPRPWRDRNFLWSEIEVARFRETLERIDHLLQTKKKTQEQP